MDPQHWVVNPEWRAIKNGLEAARRESGQLRRQLARSQAAKLPKSAKAVAATQSAKVAQLKERIAACERRIEGLKLARTKAPEQVLAGELSPEQRIQALAEPMRLLMDTLRMIVYRTKTVMAAAVGPELNNPDTARSLLKAPFRSDATILPDDQAQTLTVRLLPQATRGHDRALAPLLAELNQTRTLYPGTQLRLVYEMLTDAPS